MADQPKAPDKKKEPKERDYKGFHIKRGRGGKTFSMTIRKKIKGFEEESDMSQDKIDEAEGIKTVSTKGYHGSKPMKPKYRSSTKGFINFKAGKPESENDQKVLDWHKGEAFKEGKVTQLRYRGPRPRAKGIGYEFGADASYIRRGKATGAAVYYKDKSELGGRQRDAARKARVAARNEDIEMAKEEQLDELKQSTLKSYTGKAFDSRQKAAREDDDKTYEKRDKGYHKAADRVAGTYEPKDKRRRVYHAEEYEMNEEDEPVTELSDLVVHAIDQRPLEFQQTFADLMQQRIEDAVADRKLEIAAGFVGNTEPSDDDWDNEESGDDKDWNGTEFEDEEEDTESGESEEE